MVGIDCDVATEEIRKKMAKGLHTGKELLPVCTPLLFVWAQVTAEEPKRVELPIPAWWYKSESKLELLASF